MDGAVIWVSHIFYFSYNFFFSVATVLNTSDTIEGEANLLFHVSNMKLANNLFNIEDQQFGHFLID